MGPRSFIALALGLLAPVALPALAAAIVVFIAAVVVPPVGLVAGVISDAYYHTPGQFFPYGTSAGGVITLVGYVVHRFIKTRIMGA